MKFICYSLASITLVLGTYTTKTLANASTVAPLRSAYLQRSQGELQPLNRRDATSIRADLRSHFDTVLEMLESNRALSLQVALARLERQQGVQWSQEQREYWHDFLAENRAINVQRLAAYRNRGLFPKNDRYSLHAVPIFVDHHDTACAVGHLMREAGWEREVDMIEATNLFVYVTDVNDGPIVHWVLQSGLTQEEAALIQPGYPFSVDQNITQLAQQNATVQAGGLLYSEFSTSATGPLGSKFGQGYYVELEGFQPNVNPVGTDWMIVGGFLPLTVAHIYDVGHEEVTLKFRVRATSPNTLINQMTLQTDFFESGFGLVGSNGFGFEPFDRNDRNYELYYKYAYGIDAKITNMATSQQFTMHFTDETIDELYSFTPGNGTLSLDLPEGNDFTVEITASYTDWSDIRGLQRITLGSYIVDFNVVPEPAGLAVLSMALVCLASSRRSHTANAM